jgi:hypothetical protein
MVPDKMIDIRPGQGLLDEDGAVGVISFSQLAIDDFGRQFPGLDKSGLTLRQGKRFPDVGVTEIIMVNSAVGIDGDGFFISGNGRFNLVVQVVIIAQVVVNRGFRMRIASDKFFKKLNSGRNIFFLAGRGGQGKELQPFPCSADLIEECGGVVIGEESCTGTRQFENLVEGYTVKDLAERYFKIPCALAYKNKERSKRIKELVKELNIDGVVYYTLQYCHTFNIEGAKIEEELKEESIPIIRIETDYSGSDKEQLKTRLEAFIEMI